MSGNLGASTSWNPLGLSRPVMGLLFYFLNIIEVPDNGLRLKMNSERSCSVGFRENWTVMEAIFVKIPLINWNKS